MLKWIWPLSVRKIPFRVLSPKEAERKERTHRLIQQGVLFDLAKLEDRSHAELLGILLAAATIEDAERWKNWKEKGEAKLKELSVKTALERGEGVTSY